MQEVLDDTHDQEDHGEGQAGNRQDSKEGQTGIGSIEHGDQIGDGIGNPITDGSKNRQNSIENSSSLQKHTFQIKYINRVHSGFSHWLRPTESNGISRGKAWRATITPNRHIVTQPGAPARRIRHAAAA